MATIKIGDKVCEFEGKKSILQVALENDIEIPHYCYHPGLTVVASCRICLAEVAQPNPRNDNRVEKIPKLVPTCQHPAVDGAEVYLDSPKTQGNQKAVMEYLLINHPLDCPVCDQAGECFLQDYSYDYGRAYSRFEETKVKQPKKDIGPHVLLYSDRCIMCSRCVRFTREVSGTNEIGVFGRGNTEEIDIFPGKALDNELSGNVVDICPVGALLDKDFLFEQRVWNLKETPSIDGITASGDNLWIHHNEGRVYRVKPRANLDVNKWWISDEIRYGWKFVHDTNRLRQPLWLETGTHQETEWQVAYRELLRGLRGVLKSNRHIAVMLSPMLASEEAYLLAKFIKEFDDGASVGIGPVPKVGEDKTYPGGYTTYAEKAPNARGVRRAAELVFGQDAVMDYDAFYDLLNADDRREANIGGVVFTGNYPSAWVTTGLLEALGQRFVALIDTLPNALSTKAQVVLPGATWVEKAGCFENVNNIVQAFEAAVPLIEFARPEGQIALDLMAEAGMIEPKRFDAAATRQEMGSPFADVEVPTARDSREPDMQYVEF